MRRGPTALAVWGMMAVMFWPTGRPAAQQPELPATGFGEDGKAAEPAGEAAPRDCHGPLYYRLQREGEEQRAREQAAREMASFIEQVTPVLLEANRAHLVAVPQRLLPDYRRCLAAVRRPDFLCLALTGDEPAVCDRLPTPERREPCRAIVLSARAVRRGQSAACRELAEPDLAALCDFLVAGSASCDKLQREEVRQACRSWQAASQGRGGADLPPELAGPVAWLLALSTGQPAACDRLPERDEATACRAWVVGDPSACPLERPLEEVADGDFSCRRLVVDSRLHPTEQGTELSLLLASPYGGRASCDLLLDLRRGGEAMTRTADRFEVSGDDFWKSYHLPLGDHQLVAVRTDCRWQLADGVQ